MSYIVTIVFLVVLAVMWLKWCRYFTVRLLFNLFIVLWLAFSTATFLSSSKMGLNKLGREYDISELTRQQALLKATKNVVEINEFYFFATLILTLLLLVLLNIFVGYVPNPSKKDATKS